MRMFKATRARTSEYCEVWSAVGKYGTVNRWSLNNDLTCQFRQCLLSLLTWIIQQTIYMLIVLACSSNVLRASKDMRGQRAKCWQYRYVDLKPFVSVSTNNTFWFIFAKTLILHLLKGNYFRWNAGVKIYQSTICLTTKPLKGMSVCYGWSDIGDMHASLIPFATVWSVEFSITLSFRNSKPCTGLAQCFERKIQ